MRRCLVVLDTVFAATLIGLPGASAGDAYKSRPSDAPDALDAALTNPPAGSIVRDAVSNVVLLDKKTGYHLAQWNL